MGADIVDLLFTDPPYGVKYMEDSIPGSEQGKWHRTDGKLVDNDNLTREQTKQLLVDAFSLVDTVLKPGGVFYCCSPSGADELSFRLALTDVGWELRQVIAWVKQRFVFGRQDYHWRHESILYGWKKGAAHYFIADHTQDTVWEVDNQRVSVEHPTMKPVELVTRAVRNSSRSGEHVLDCFAGSGTTLVVCESLGRIGHMVEKNTGYGDVIIRRWQEFTHQEAYLEGTELSFAQVGKDRWDATDAASGGVDLVTQTPPFSLQK
jgi:site-specific DNA-methyltransferase (adenine-specific)